MTSGEVTVVGDTAYEVGTYRMILVPRTKGTDEKFPRFMEFPLSSVRNKKGRAPVPGLCIPNWLRGSDLN